MPHGPRCDAAGEYVITWRHTWHLVVCRSHVASGIDWAIKQCRMADARGVPAAQVCALRDWRDT
jgi:hypothetical protein